MRRLTLLLVALALLAACGQPLAIPTAATATSVPRPAPTAALPTPAATPAPAPTIPAPAAAPAAAPTAVDLPAVASGPWRFVILGDTRTSGLMPPPTMNRIVARARDARPAVVIGLGDLVKSLNDPASVRQQWRNWKDAVAPLGAKHILPTPGNHDVESGAWTQPLLAEAFPELPANGPPGQERLAYAFDYGGVRFISLNSETYGAAHRLGEAQLTWLAAQLRDNPNRATVVFTHDPAYPVGSHVGSSLDAYPQERDRLWALLRDNGATVFLAGHEHLYNRRTINGVVQVIAGTSGSYPYSGWGGDFYHYIVGEVSLRAVTMVVYDIEGVERDRFDLPLRRT
jgi:Icc protein